MRWFDKQQGVIALGKFARAISQSGITSRAAYKEWAKANVKLMSGLFEYEQVGNMPPVTSVVGVDFHPRLPLIKFNYTQVAHNVLHGYPSGWTRVLRLCRGIVFDTYGQLVALPFEKFFNYGEMEETSLLPNCGFEATCKMDGHLGIIFKYKGEFVVTTRGSFRSRSSVLATEMLSRYVKDKGWNNLFDMNKTVLVEIIHPETEVHVNYGGEEAFVLIGANRTTDLTDLDHAELKELGSRLSLPVTDVWGGDNIVDLIAFMKDRGVRNQEGFVARFENGLRVKFKFESYIGLMVQSKLTYPYLMLRLIAGNTERMISTLDEEVYPFALSMLGEIAMHATSKGTQKERWTRLYTLLPPEKDTSYARGVCRKFIKWMDEGRP